MNNTFQFRNKINRKLRKIFRLKKLFVNLYSVKPTSNVFGLDRGTPIDRFYIEDFLNLNAALIKGNVLEIGDSTYSRKYGENIEKINVLHYNNTNSEATIVGDLSKPETLPDSEFDAFICTQTLNFIFNVKEAISGCHKVLAENGVFLGTVAGISQISRYDMQRWGDYWRFTDLSVKKLFEEVFGDGHVEVQVYGNALAATAFIQGISVEEIFDKNKLMSNNPDYQVIICIKAYK
jgi:SAM-dependent methyltransferase